MKIMNKRRKLLLLNKKSILVKNSHDKDHLGSPSEQATSINVSILQY